MVEKVEGKTMTCRACGTILTCRLSNYGGSFKDNLQWQNRDGKAHYKTTDGKNFSCNIPDEEDDFDDSTPHEKVDTVPPRTSGDSADSTTVPLPQIVKLLDSISIKIHTCQELIEDLDIRLARNNEMTEAVFQYVVDKQLEKK